MSQENGTVLQSRGMSSVWKRLQRVNKRAAKFQYTLSFHSITVETTCKWKPRALSIVWTRRGRRLVTEPVLWEPTMKEPLRGSAVWAVPDNRQAAVTLFKDPRSGVLEDKDWMLILDDVSATGKRRQLAVYSLNMKQYASVDSRQHHLTVEMKPTSKKIITASVDFTISSLFLREGKATDDDMQSMASLMSTNNNSDIGQLEDFDEEEEEEHAVNSALKHEVSDLANQLDQLTHSISGSDFASTPISVASLKDDTPVAVEEIPTFPSEQPLMQGNSTPKPKEVYCELSLNSINKKSGEPEGGVSPPGRVESSAGQELLEWCKEVTRGYAGIRVTNLTTSWRNGLAFCAVIHHFRPDLVDFESLSLHEPRVNLKKAFDAGEALGVPRLIDPNEMDVAAIPDKLAVMTYLYQLRTHFAGDELEVQQIGVTADKSSYMIGRFTSDCESGVSQQMFSQEIITLRSKASGDSNPPKPGAPDRLRLRLKLDQAREQPESKSPTSVADKIFASSKNIIGKVLSPTKDKFKGKSLVNNSNGNKRPVLMTRRQLNDPFGSDEEEEKITYGDGSWGANGHTQRSGKNNSGQPGVVQGGKVEGSVCDPGGTVLESPTSQAMRQMLVMRHDELKERARQLLDSARRDYSPLSPVSSQCEEERQAALRERARRLLAEAKMGLITPPTSPSGANVKESSSGSNKSSPRRSLSPSTPVKAGSECNGNGARIPVSSPLLDSFSSILDRVSPEPNQENATYISNEMEALEREQKQIDEQAAELEGKLRDVMEAGSDRSHEEQLMARWFTLVNKKNALLRRQMQLNILEKEDNLERRFELLTRELRKILNIEDWQKTEEQKVRENLLLTELVNIVNKRDELVHHLDSQEKAIEDDDRIEEDLIRSRAERLDKNPNCCIQ